MKDYLFINPRTDCSDLSDDSITSFVPMTNVQEKNNCVQYDFVKYKSVKKGFTVFQKDDLIWAKITPCMQNGKSCVVSEMPTEIGFGSTEFHVIRKKNNDIYMPFIWAVFSSSDFLKAAQAVFSGSAGQQRVPASFLERFPALLPSYDRQVKMVSDLAEKLNDLNQKLQEADNLMSELDNFVFRILNISMPNFTNRICGAVCLSDLKSDKTFSADYYHPERIATIDMMKNQPHLTTDKLNNLVDFHRDTVSSVGSLDNYLGLAGVMSNTGELNGILEKAVGQAFSYEIGDVLYGRLRPYLNKVMLAEKSGISSTEFHVMRIKTTKVIPDYLAIIMRTSLIVSQTKHMMTGNTHPRISNDDVKNLYIPIPKTEVQQYIAEEVIKRRNESRQLKQKAEKAWINAKAQFQNELLWGTKQ